jgi:hypothetical protein
VKPVGQVIIGAIVGSGGALVGLVRWHSRQYHLVAFFLASVVVFSPLYVPYYPHHWDSFLMMLRMSIPQAASGAILLCAVVYRIRNAKRGALRWLHIEPAVILVSLLSLVTLVPAYTRFQEAPLLCFEVADEVIEHYEGGTIVCGHPTVNYRLVERWGVGASDLLGNHYSPNYYGITDPVEYARWFDRNNVTLWLYLGEGSQPVWAVASNDLPGLLIGEAEVNGASIFSVNRGALEKALPR